MARRNLVNLAEKIILATISIGGKEGIEGVPAKKIAQACDITDATVFVYYKTKDNLLDEAYKYVADKFLQELKTQNLAIAMQKYKEVWNHMFDYAVKNDELTRFSASFRHSKHFINSFDCEKTPFFENLPDSIKSNLNTKNVSALWQMLVNIFFELALAVKDNKIDVDEIMRGKMYDMSFGAFLK